MILFSYITDHILLLPIFNPFGVEKSGGGLLHPQFHWGLIKVKPFGLLIT
jgi:hypothetical protein